MKPPKRERYPPDTPISQEENKMPYYDYRCQSNHTQELKMSFAEHSQLEKDDLGIFVPCNVRYGDTKQPVCPNKAYQIFGNVGFSGLETARP